MEQKQTELNSVIQELKTVSNNLARAKTDDQYTATAKVFDQVQEKQKQLEEELDLLKRKAEPVGSISSFWWGRAPGQTLPGTDCDF